MLGLRVSLDESRVLLSASEFRDLVSGQRRGVSAALLRFGLGLAEAPYTFAVRMRNRRYDAGRGGIVHVDVPVISVGNLTLGGTGKTPMVAWLARWFRAQGVRVTIISRGYGAIDGGQNDEARELEEQVPDVPHLQNPDRAAAAHVAINELAAQLVVLDDGFQHRRLGRDLDILLVDALEPFGFDHVFPRGTLREPLTGMVRADVIGLTRADMIDQGQREAIRQRVQSINPCAVWIELAHQPQELISCGGQQLELDSLQGASILAFCGIGNPAGFRHTIATCGWQVIDFREFPDHHRYSRQDVESLRDWVASHAHVKVVLCTHKDLVKLGVDRLGHASLYALSIQLNTQTGFDQMQAKLLPLLHRARQCDDV